MWGAHDARHPNYNLPLFDPMWALIQDCDVPITFHVSTGRDPRAARNDGGAIINYAAHSLAPTIEPVASLCASGVIERFPKLRFAAIECGIGWVPWALDRDGRGLSQASPVGVSEAEEAAERVFSQQWRGVLSGRSRRAALAEHFNLVDNFMWANDYPHAEGTWPHSAEAIEREMGI